MAAGRGGSTGGCCGCKGAESVLHVCACMHQDDVWVHGEEGCTQGTNCPVHFKYSLPAEAERTKYGEDVGDGGSREKGGAEKKK